ncbi:hypothetical protein RQP46_004230 [Phenoliferia psychrophenolica]
MQHVDVVALLRFALPSRNLIIIWMELSLLWTLLIAFLLLITFLTAHLLLKLGSAAVSCMIPTKPAAVQYVEIEQADVDDCSDESSSSTSSASSATTTEIARTLPAESEPLPLIIDTTSHLSTTFSTLVEHKIRTGLAFHSSILLNALVLSLDETSLDFSLESDNTPSSASSDFASSSESDSESDSDASSIVDGDDDLPCPSSPIVELSATTSDVLPPSPSPLHLSLPQSTLNPSASTFAPSPSPLIALSNLSATAASFAPAPTPVLPSTLLKVDLSSPSINELNLQAEMTAAEQTKLEGDRFLREVNAKWERSPEGLARAREWREEWRMQSEWTRWSTMSWESRQEEIRAYRMEREKATQWARWQMGQQRMRAWGC